MTEAALVQLLAAWAAQWGPSADEAPADEAGTDGGGADGAGADEPTVVIEEVEVLLAGRPGLLDVIAAVDGRPVHAVLGLHRPGDEVHLLRAADQPVLGLLEDDHGLALVVDALRDAELAPLVLAAVTGGPPDPGPVIPVADTPEVTALAFGDRVALSVFCRLAPSPRPDVDLLMALDAAGFNHLAAPLARWRRGGRDLGLVQERLAGSAGAWALALTSLRDLSARGGRPEDAGGDFGPEARALGTMTARMHLALDRAFGRQVVPVADWVDQVEAAAAGAAAAAGTPIDPRAAAALDALRSTGLRGAAIRTHGDFHLGRIARTDHGWVVADCRPGGIPPGNPVSGDPVSGDPAPVMRSPLADVADLLWSLHRAAVAATTDRDPADRAAVIPLADAWEVRNRRAFMAGYLATPGIGGLLPTSRDHVVALVAAFELAREAVVAAPA